MDINKKYIQNKDNNISQNENDSNNRKKCNIFVILTIDKNNYDKDQIKINISDFFGHSQNATLINAEEKKYDKKGGVNSEIKIIQLLYNIPFIPKDSKSPIQLITLNLRIKNDLKDINSNSISVKNKDYIFIYEHSLEDISRNNKNKIRLNIFQNKLDLLSKLINGKTNLYLYLLLKILLGNWKKTKFIFL